MNARVERFNRTIQEEFIDYHITELLNPDIFNALLVDQLIFHNIDRVHTLSKTNSPRCNL